MNIIDKIRNKTYKRSEPYKPNLESDWNKLESLFNCKFDDVFKNFHEVLLTNHIEGGFLTIREIYNCDSIKTVYEQEMECGNLTEDYIPIYDVGNGDCVCMKASECPQSKIYYISHDDDQIECLHDSFKDLISDTDWIEI
ncbi:SMI1/KNR4 family protein [Lentisphaera marina]|uniref:SMI1/KNR4 family protein n=1 Tax=Lentisphaera marina TaxID=1111041 RepID=UPI0023672D8D|nr:SMI1/KNR4 family protein [Lentisphaera marina]MDD7987140.1 SMI1/KNR4 family protein [Lentisphaera marina]MDD7987159.1 SMI1/KNR4 family protein [Lentisphaera marina]